MNTLAEPEKFKALAKMGYVARGSVYLVIGGLAVLTAIGKGGETTDSKGAIVEIMQQPFGVILLVILIIGLFGFVAWRLIQAIRDPDSHGTSAKGFIVRAALAMSAITHGLLAIWAINMLLGKESESQGGGSQKGEQFLATDAGPIIIGVLGLIFAGAGIALIYKGWTAKFEKYMQIPADKKRWATPVCRFGLISRGFVWCIVAWFCIKSAIFARTGEIKGIAEALDVLRGQPYGVWLFGVVAAGLFAFGVYSILEAMYRRINTSGTSA